jgi:hypothetical protein
MKQPLSSSYPAEDHDRTDSLVLWCDDDASALLVHLASAKKDALDSVVVSRRLAVDAQRNGEPEPAKHRAVDVLPVKEN